MQQKEFISLIHDVIEVEDGTYSIDTALEEIEEWDSVSLITFMAVADEHFSDTPMPDAIHDAVTLKDLMNLFGDQIQ